MGGREGCDSCDGREGRWYWRRVWDGGVGGKVGR